MDLGAHRAGPEAGAAIDGSALLKVLIPRLWAISREERFCNYLYGLRARLRACSREALRLSDSCVRSLQLRWDRVETPAKRAAAVAELRSMLGRGVRPRKLVLELDGSRRPAVATALGLRVLAELRAVSPPPQLTKLQLSALPLTAAVVRAIAVVAPCPVELALTSYDLSYCTGLPSSLPFRPSLSGVQGLLRLTGPHLQQLSLNCTLAPVCDSLASLLLQCSRLETLEMRLRDEVPNTFGVVLSALAQLPALRSLNMDFPLAHDASGCVMLPTGLTRLVLCGLPPDLDAVASALAGMRSLAELRLNCKLRPRHLQQLAGLTALTRLEVRGIWATDDPSAGASGGLAAPAAQPKVPVPGQLRALALYGTKSPSEVAALQLSPALLRVWVGGLAVQAGDKDAEGCVCPPAAEMLLAACRQLVGRLSYSFGPDAEDPFELDLRGAAAPASWPDGYGTLFAAMQPLALRGLTVWRATLTLYDMDALVRHLPLLEDLRLHCAVELPSLPLLCGLKRLAFLTLSPGEGGVVEGWDNVALRTVLLVVCVEAPSLRDVFISVPESEALFEAAALAVEWLDEELPKLRDDPPNLEVG